MAEREAVTVIGADAKFKGELTLDGSARILGSFEGRIASSGDLAVGPAAVVEASIEAEAVTIEGTVHGDVLARQRLTLAGKGTLKGDIATGSLSVAEGTTLVGHCRVGPDALSSARGAEASQVEPKANGRAAAQPEWAGQAGGAEWAQGQAAPGGKPTWLAGLTGG